MQLQSFDRECNPQFPRCERALSFRPGLELKRERTGVTGT
jgi:hypothetical protein